MEGVALKILAIPWGGPSVRNYRYLHPMGDLGEVEFCVFDRYGVNDTQPLDRGKEYLRKIGLFIDQNGPFDAVWTGDYTPETWAVVSHLKSIGVMVIGEVDDWFEGIPETNVAHPYWYGRKRMEYNRLLKAADRITCTTPKLAERFQADVCQNYIDPGEWDWKPRVQKREDEVVLCCPSGTGRAGDYYDLEEPLQKVLALDSAKILFMGWIPDWALQYPAGKVIWSRWVKHKKYSRMMRWIAPDVLLSPMQHHDFNLAKSNIKWLEAAMAGAVFVGERWGEYERTVKDGATGFLADGKADWTETLMHVCTDSQHRKAVAAAGRAEVLKSWTWEAVSADWRKGVLGDGASLDRSVHDPGERCLTAATG